MNDKDVTHIVVDMLFDFIEGTLACKNAKEAVTFSVKYINGNPKQKVIFVCDSHPSDHCSFVQSGGVWPPHCVAGTPGSEIDGSYYRDVENPGQRPSETNIFRKGAESGREQYSGYQAVNSRGETIGNYLKANYNGAGSPPVVVSGIATEFCINETVSDLLREGFRVFLLKDGLGYVDYKNHIQTLKDLSKKGVTLI
ncbi:MAG: isochorismatase family protein [Bacteroidales bacterium]|nr:isochorismatase family protein [Bacteroidales bacterium]MDD2424648.1 isochorismatase family protein [Bacteroidales bacterium]MDD3989132.1 isochorismatase family protein [Bacteroidales bacterium]MDD4639526.1 isochorismatase family protein [Bacteroidales bacterium]